MPSAHTLRFGVLEYDEASVLSFPRGLPGFEDQTRFLMIENADLAPILCFQSLSSAELCFLAVRVAAIQPDYALAINEEDMKWLGLEGSDTSPPSGVLCLALLCAPVNGPMTANLLAPVVVNTRTRVAVQAVRSDSLYSHQHPISPEITPETICS